MNTDEILREIEAEISRLQRARELFAGRAGAGTRRARKAARRGRKAASGAAHRTTARQAATARPVAKKRIISAEGRAKIAAAQKRRWARQKQAQAAAS